MKEVGDHARPAKIISGGQTGADRAALDVAIACGIPHGGWCPRGRGAEDGSIPSHYELIETVDSAPAQRTEWNVRDSDVTLILSVHARIKGGTALAAEIAARLGKPCLHLSRAREGEDFLGLLKDFFRAHSNQVVNIAGPRESEEPGIGQFAREMLIEALGGNAVF